MTIDNKLAVVCDFIDAKVESIYCAATYNTGEIVSNAFRCMFSCIEEIKTKEIDSGLQLDCIRDETAHRRLQRQKVTENQLKAWQKARESKIRGAEAFLKPIFGNIINITVSYTELIFFSCNRTTTSFACDVIVLQLMAVSKTISEV